MIVKFFIATCVLVLAIGVLGAVLSPFYTAINRLLTVLDPVINPVKARLTKILNTKLW